MLWEYMVHLHGLSWQHCKMCAWVKLVKGYSISTFLPFDEVNPVFIEKNI